MRRSGWRPRRAGSCSLSRPGRSLRRLRSSRRGQHELIPIGILEHSELAPRLLLRTRHELDAAGAQLAIGCRHVVASERAVEERADAALVAFGREQHDARRGVGDAQLDPALLVVEWLIGRDLEAELLGVELERARLVASRDAYELELRDHRTPPRANRSGRIMRLPPCRRWR